MVFPRYISFSSHLDSTDELPVALAFALNEMGIDAEAGVSYDDEGWMVTFRHNGVRYRFCSRFDMSSEPLDCMGWIQRDVGFLASLFGPRETYEYPVLEPMIQSALVRLPIVQNPVWHSGDDTATSTLVD